MAYLISETGQELLQDTKLFCEREVYGKAAAWDREGRMPEYIRESLCQMGYQTLTIPEKYGGLGISSVDTAAILEEIARADAGLAVTLAGSNLALRAVLAGGAEDQKETVCSILADGGLGAFCLTESQAGSDAMNLKTKAVPLADGEWELTGTKQFVTNGSTADFYVVAAMPEGGGTALSKGDPAAESGSVEMPAAPILFLIEKGAAGLHSGPQENKLGIRSCDTCEVSLDHCIVPADALLGGDAGLMCSERGTPEATSAGHRAAKHGTKAILASLNEGRAFLAAMATGVAQRALDEAVHYGKERIQFDRPITDNQAIRFALADMQIKIEAARQLTAYALQKMDEATAFAAEAAMAKAFAADTVIEVTSKAMEIFGGYGYMSEFPAEKLLRDAQVFRIIEGTGQMQRTVIAGRLLGPVQEGDENGR